MVDHPPPADGVADARHPTAAGTPPSDAPLCAKCLAPYVEGADLCASCGRPLSIAPWIGPVQGSVADVWFMGEAAERSRPRLLHVVGMWLLTLPSIVVFSLFAFETRDVHMAVLVVAVAWSVLVGILVHRTTRNYLRARRLPPFQDE